MDGSESQPLRRFGLGEAAPVGNRARCVVDALSVAEVATLSVGELRHRCDELGVAHGRFVEKRELVAAVVANSARAKVVLLDSMRENLKEAPRPLRIVFLDVDGILSTTRRGYCPSSQLSAACVSQLVSLLDSTDARVVLSSSWRLDLLQKLELWEQLMGAGMPRDRLIGQTVDIAFKERANEISHAVGART